MSARGDVRIKYLRVFSCTIVKQMRISIKMLAKEKKKKKKFQLKGMKKVKNWMWNGFLNIKQISHVYSQAEREDKSGKKRNDVKIDQGFCFIRYLFDLSYYICLLNDILSKKHCHTTNPENRYYAMNKIYLNHINTFFMLKNIFYMLSCFWHIQNAIFNIYICLNV